MGNRLGLLATLGLVGFSSAAIFVAPVLVVPDEYAVRTLGGYGMHHG
jgi:hypothetical protein